VFADCSLQCFVDACGVWIDTAHCYALVLHYLEHHPDPALWAYTPLPAEYDHPGTARRLAVLDEIAAETGTNRNRVVLAWLTSGFPAVTPIVGVSTVKQLDEAVAGVSLQLTAEQRERLDYAV
jgi:aryl-alcohol dehydrogenase-like predicted oxidoreductase